MELIKILDCFDNEHLINTKFIYKLTVIPPRTEKDKVITVVHLNHKDDNYTFSDVRTHELKVNLQKRLEKYK